LAHQKFGKFAFFAILTTFSAKWLFFIEISNLYEKIEKPIFIFAGKTLVIKLFNYNVFF